LKFGLALAKVGFEPGSPLELSQDLFQTLSKLYWKAYRLRKAGRRDSSFWI